MDFAHKGDLYEAINTHTKENTRFTEEQIWSIVIQITRGLKALHDLKILHRDIKSANVFLFEDGVIKLGDMNVSKMSRNMCKTQTGTPYYASPQVWKDQPYDKKSDVWSLGCVIYEAVALKPPFRANDMEGLFKKVTRGFYPHIPPEYSQEVTIVLKMMLQVTPHLRCNCDRILEFPIVMKHANCLPERLQNLQDDHDDKLLQTIKLNFNSKEKMSILMPKPRYYDAPDRPGKKPSTHVEIIDKDFHNISLKKQLEGKDRLPRLVEDRKREKVHSEIGARSSRQEDIVDRMMDVRIDQAQKLNKKRNRDKFDRFDLNSERKLLPPVLQGRLRSISPENLIKIIQKEREKQRLYSIIGNNP